MLNGYFMKVVFGFYGLEFDLGNVIRDWVLSVWFFFLKYVIVMCYLFSKI